jgi:hypothetical protein
MTLAPIAAGVGSLAGFRITCNCCGYNQTCSIETLANEWAREHQDWHLGRGAFATKKARRSGAAK